MDEDASKKYDALVDAGAFDEDTQPFTPKGSANPKKLKWEDLSEVAKEFYLSHISDNSNADHVEAAAALKNFLDKYGAKRQSEKESNSKIGKERYQKRLKDTATYLMNYDEAGEHERMHFPDEFSDLSPEAQKVFRDALGGDYSVEDQDRAFKALADYLESQGQHRAAPEQSISKKAESGAAFNERQNREHRAQEITAQERVQAERTTLEHLQNGDMNAALEAMPVNGTGMFANIMRHLVNILKGFDFSEYKCVVGDRSNPEIDRLVSENKVAGFDPKTKTFYFVKDHGYDQPVILHEVVHAVTAAVMHDFKENGGRNLTATQREAAQHIMKIYDEIGRAHV